MGEGGKYCLVSRKSGRKKTNIVGEQRIKTFCFSDSYCSGRLGSPRAIFVDRDRGREEEIASRVGSLERGETLQTVPAASRHCHWIKCGIATKTVKP